MFFEATESIRLRDIATDARAAGLSISLLKANGVWPADGVALAQNPSISWQYDFTDSVTNGLWQLYKDSSPVTIGGAEVWVMVRRSGVPGLSGLSDIFRPGAGISSIGGALRRFIKDIYLTGTPGSTIFYPAEILRNSSSTWQVSIFNDSLVKVCEFTTGTNPHLDPLVIHELTEVGGSGISGNIALDWGEIPDGANYTGLYAGYELTNELFNNEGRFLLGIRDNTDLIETLELTGGAALVDDVYVEKNGSGEITFTLPYRNVLAGDATIASIGGPRYAGAVARQGRGGVLSIEDFLDFSTLTPFTMSDNTKFEENAAAIKQAVQFAGNNGFNVLMFPAGEFWCDEVIILGSEIPDGLKLVGHNTKWTFKKTVTTDPYNQMLALENCSNVTIEGFDFVGNDNLYSNAIVGIKTVGLCSDIRYEKCFFSNIYNLSFNKHYNEATQTQGDYDSLVLDRLRISDCVFRNPIRFSGSWINHNGYVHDFLISDCRFLNDDKRSASFNRESWGTYKDCYSEWGIDSDFYFKALYCSVVNCHSWACGKDAFKFIGLESSTVRGVGSGRVYGCIVRGAGRLVAGSPVCVNIEGEPVSGGGNFIVANNIFEGEDPTLQLVGGVPTTGQTPWANATNGIIGVNVFTTNVIIANNIFRGRNSEFIGTGWNAFGIGVNIKRAVITGEEPTFTAFDYTDGFVKVVNNQFNDMRQALIMPAGTGGIIFDSNEMREISYRTIEKLGGQGSILFVRNCWFHNCAAHILITNLDSLFLVNNITTGTITGAWENYTNVTTVYKHNHIIVGNNATPWDAGVITDTGVANGRSRQVIKNPRVAGNELGPWEDMDST